MLATPNQLIDFLTYSSWRYQVRDYGVSFEDARKIYSKWKKYEEVYALEVQKKLEVNNVA